MIGIVIPFAQWKDIYEPIYGSLADQSLYDAHRTLDGDGNPDRYLQLIPAAARKALGEFYTPEWLAEQVLDRAGYKGEPLLDPSCGAGAFLAKVGKQATGWEINPLAARIARARCPLASIEVQDAFTAVAAQPFPFVVGNPPWVNWRNLGTEYRSRIDPLWREYGLFDQRGLKARLGGAMDDLSSLMTYVCADRHLALDGRLAFLLPMAHFRSAGGGSAFRRFVLPGGLYLRVVRIEEVTGTRAFEGAMTRAVIAVFEKSRTPTVYPVPYMRESVEHDAAPVSKDPAAPWSVMPKGAAASEIAGKSAYVARVGAHSGGAAGVYWVDVLEECGPLVLIRNRADTGRNTYAEVTAEVERELVYPLVRGRDLRERCATASAHIILPHRPSDGKPIEVDQMQRDYPRAYAYFEQFREPMLTRPHYLRHFEKLRKPYWSLYNVGPYTFARHRVAWREQSTSFQCAILKEGDIADAKLVTIALDSAEEAAYVADFLNREDVRTFIDSYVLRTQISTHVMKYVHIPPFRG